MEDPAIGLIVIYLYIDIGVRLEAYHQVLTFPINCFPTLIRPEIDPKIASFGKKAVHELDYPLYTVWLKGWWGRRGRRGRRGRGGQGANFQPSALITAMQYLLLEVL